jgi:predicted kinase
VLVVISGLPGTGKSAVAVAVAEHLTAVHLSVDPVEDAMLGAGLRRDWTTGVAAYEAVRIAAETNLAMGWSVVVDAVNDSEAARQTWRSAASNTGVPISFVVLTMTDPVEHRRRLERRTREFVNLPEPTWGQVETRARACEPWSGDYLAVSADEALSEVVLAVLEGVVEVRTGLGRRAVLGSQPSAK